MTTYSRHVRIPDDKDRMRLARAARVLSRSCVDFLSAWYGVHGYRPATDGELTMIKTLQIITVSARNVGRNIEREASIRDRLDEEDYENRILS